MTAKPGVSYYYDTNPFGATENTAGRLAGVSWTVNNQSFQESYGYTRAGRTKWKHLTVSGDLVGEAQWTWDNEGRPLEVTYPQGERRYRYSYDSMGRLSGMTDLLTNQTVVSGAQYNMADQMTSLSYLGYTETRQYNARLQLTRLTASGSGLPSVDLEYRFAATTNDGRITQMKDWVTGEEVNYTYDSLARLNAAWTTGPEWGQAYSYDGFGNLTAKTVTKGSGPMFSAAYDAATNRQVGQVYDANGNLIPGGPSGQYSYDIENRLKGPWVGTNTDAYNYDPWNRLVYRFITVSSSRDDEEVTFYGLSGERMGIYIRSTYHDPYERGTFYSTGAADVQFGGKRIEAAKQGVVVMDRLGTVVAAGGERRRFWPWGEERGTTAQGWQKWATYWRTDDGIDPGMDHAVNRFYQNGRFLTPDPYTASGGAAVPQSFNRYGYVENDPVNSTDPTGLLKENCGSSWATDPSLSGPCDGTSAGGDFEPRPWSLWGPDIWIQNPTTGSFYQNGQDQVMIPLSVYNSLVSAGFLPSLAGAGAAGGVIIVAGGPVTWTITVTGAIVITGVALYQSGILQKLIDAIKTYGKRDRAVDDEVRIECEEYAHANADNSGKLRYGPDWMKDFSRCIQYGGVLGIPK